MAQASVCGSIILLGSFCIVSSFCIVKEWLKHGALRLCKHVMIINKDDFVRESRIKESAKMRPPVNGFIEYISMLE